ncbi:MAG TPA: hypothetical protein VK911_15955, partial [Vicinamibacterales bacterium]|nr:hypothetical protein [Vicinamibacterales bacterium]
KEDLLFAGTEFGLYATVDGGRRWVELGGNVPTISFRDIEVHEREGDLVAASFGRGIFVLDDYSPLRHLGEEALAREAVLFPVKKALRYIPRRPIDSSGKGTLGDGFYAAPNPPFGAVFTYHLREAVRTGAEARREDEKAREKAGKPVTFPGWDALRAEDTEEKPAIVLTVRDEAGQVVRQVTGPAGKGIHRVAWDLRYPAVDPTVLEEPQRESWDRAPVGPLVVPGRFTVSLAKRVGGVLTPLGEPQAFEVEALTLATLPEKDRAALLAFQKKAGELQRAMMGTSAAAQEALKNIGFMKKALLDTPGADPALGDRVRTIEAGIREKLRLLSGDRTVRRRSEPTLPSLMDRVSAQLDATGPITATVQHDYGLAAAAFERLQGELRALIDEDLRRAGDALESAGAPWTPGRGVPVWKK